MVFRENMASSEQQFRQLGFRNLTSELDIKLQTFYTPSTYNVHTLLHTKHDHGEFVKMSLRLNQDNFHQHGHSKKKSRNMAFDRPFEYILTRKSHR